MKRLRDILMLLTAFWLLFSCSEDKGQMLRQLEMLEEANRADSVMNNDSLAEDLVTYFDKHGTPNERMRARYILGRTYYDMGELPRALETYLEAADCADTTSSDCEFVILSKAHLQSASIYEQLIQPKSQLSELRKAEKSAKKGKDISLALECYAQTAEVYKMQEKYDSVIVVVKTASELFKEIHKPERSAQILGSAITSLIKCGDLATAKKYKDEYESKSGYFDEDGLIKEGHKLYYYIKGEYYLASNQLDSAEISFRQLLKEGHTLNHRIAGNKGLQEVYERKNVSDSIAKYANLGYILNDSAYSLSEMDNLQRVQASYNYNHNKLLAEQKTVEAGKNKLLAVILSFILIVLMIVFLFFFFHLQNKRKLEEYRHKKDLEDLGKLQIELMTIFSDKKLSPEEIYDKKNLEIRQILERVIEYKQKLNKQSIVSLDERLVKSEIVNRLKEMSRSNPYKKADKNDFKLLQTLINDEIPSFYSSLNKPDCILTEIEYEVSLLIRVHFTPADIHKLTGLSNSYVSNIRTRLLLKVFHIDGSPKDFDEKVREIT